MVDRKTAELFLNEYVKFNRLDEDTNTLHFRVGKLILVTNTEITLQFPDQRKETTPLPCVFDLKNKTFRGNFND